MEALTAAQQAAEARWAGVQQQVREWGRESERRGLCSFYPPTMPSKLRPHTLDPPQKYDKSTHSGRSAVADQWRGAQVRRRGLESERWVGEGGGGQREREGQFCPFPLCARHHVLSLPFTLSPGRPQSRHVPPVGGGKFWEVGRVCVFVSETPSFFDHFSFPLSTHNRPTTWRPPLTLRPARRARGGTRPRRREGERERGEKIAPARALFFVCFFTPTPAHPPHSPPLLSTTRTCDALCREAE